MLKPPDTLSTWPVSMRAWSEANTAASRERAHGRDSCCIRDDLSIAARQHDARWPLVIVGVQRTQAAQRFALAGTEQQQYRGPRVALNRARADAHAAPWHFRKRSELRKRTKVVAPERVRQFDHTRGCVQRCAARIECDMAVAVA